MFEFLVVAFIGLVLVGVVTVNLVGGEAGAAPRRPAVGSGVPAMFDATKPEYFTLGPGRNDW